MNGDRIDWPALCDAGALLALRIDDDADECRRDGCTRAAKHSGPHNGQPVKKRPVKKRENEWRFG